jgi:predicted unusual protein kinase regulating ubiquinone biosynthesis (AarF/ABC1/UbiB family)
MTRSTATIPASDPKGRRRQVEERLRTLGRPMAARRPPPEGRLSADERPNELRAALVALGPVFASFGRYLSTRIDLLSRRELLELAAIEDRRDPMTESEVAALLREQLGGEMERRFFGFTPVARAATLWTEQHDAWLAPEVQVVVTLVRADAAARLDVDAPLLPLLGPWLGVPADAVASAVDDFAVTLRRRLDQLQQAAGFIRLAADADAGGALTAPVCYRDYCAPGVLTLERVDGVALDVFAAAGRAPSASMDLDTAAQRLASAWLRQAATGHVVPFDFDLRHVVVSSGRVMLVDAAFEPQPAAARARFFGYLNAVAATDPDAAWAWIGGAASPDSGAQPEDELRRRLRQAVPFRDGEWSGDDRLAEQVLVQWRVTRESGWKLQPHQLHMYRGLQAIAGATERLAPNRDALLAALESERLRIGFSEARQMIDPRALPGALDALVQNMASLPQKLDDVLTMAAEGRLSVKLHVPESPEHRRVRDRTVSLVVSLVALTALAFLLRQVVPAYGPAAEWIGAMVLLIVGGWLLVAAARL